MNIIFKVFLGCLLSIYCVYGMAQTQRLIFNSGNPIDFPQLLTQKPKNSQVIWGLLDLPEKQSKVPLVIMIGGSSGILPSMDKYVIALNRMGIATLRIDSLSPRGVKQTVTDQAAISLAMLVADTYAAFNAMTINPKIDPKRIAILGWSKGGLISLMTAFEDLNSRLIQNKSLRFAAHIAFYPACNMIFPNTHLDGSPWLYLHGGNDDYTSVGLCLNLINKERNEAPITALLFPYANHAFDNDKDILWDRFAQNPANCQGKLLSDWTLTDAHTGNILHTSWDFKKAFWRCMRLGAHTGNNKAASLGAMQALKTFLREHLQLDKT